MILVMVISVIVLTLAGLPIFAGFLAAAMLGLHSTGVDFSAIAIEIFRLANAPILLAIPLFTFAGYLLSESGAPRRLIRLSNAVLGWLPGGLSIIALVICAAFTALTGATGLTIIALGGILLPALLRARYPEMFSLGLLTTSGTLGLLFPPSLPLIIYAIVAKVRIDQLFVAGILPGVLLVLLLSAFSVRRAVKVQVPRARFRAGEIVEEVRALANPEIESIRLFDCYRGTPVPAGKKSLAYTIAYRGADRTLTDDEANALHATVVERLTRRFALELRT